MGATALIEAARQDVGASFERFCLTTGVATLSSLLASDGVQLCGSHHGSDPERTGHRWGRTKGKLGFHGGTVPMDRPRVRSREGGEGRLPSGEAAQAEDRLGKWAMNPMLIKVSTRRYGRAVRRPEGDMPAFKADGRAKSSVSRRFVVLSAERMKAWMASDLSELDLLIIQIDGIHIEEDLMLLAAVGSDGDGRKHPLGVVEGATENTVVVQAPLDNPIRRGQVHKARNITERLAKPLHVSVRKVLRQAWELRRSKSNAALSRAASSTGSLPIFPAAAAAFCTVSKWTPLPYMSAIRTT